MTHSNIFLAACRAIILSFAACSISFGVIVIDADHEKLDGIISLENVEQVPGRNGKVFQFNGKDSVIKLPYRNSINPKAGTIQMWMRTPDVAEVPLPTRLLFSAYFFGGRFFLSELHSPSLSKVQLSSIYRRNIIRRDLGKYEDYRINLLPGDKGWRAKDWHFLAWTWGSGKLKLYVDGVLSEAVDCPKALPTGNGDFCVGGNYKGKNSFKGEIDSIVISKTERSAEKILRDFKSGFTSTESSNNKAPSQALQSVFFAAPPVIDGGLADRCWMEASLATPFHTTTDGRPSPKETRSYIGYDASNLYVAFKCSEADMTQRVPAPKGGKPFFADSVEFFVAPSGLKSKKYFQIAVDFTGQVVATASIQGTGDERQYDDLWNPDLKISASRAEAGFWSIEMAIPISSFRAGDDSNFASDWGISFARTLMKPKKIFTTWALGSKHYHDLDHFGVLLGIGDKLANAYRAVVDRSFIKGLETLEPELQVDLTSHSVEEVSMSLELTVIDQEGESAGSLEHDFVLTPRQLSKLSLPFRISQRGPLTYRIDIADQEKGLTVWSSGNRFVNVPDEAEIQLSSPHYRDTIFSDGGRHSVIGSIKIHLPSEQIGKVSGTLTLRAPDGSIVRTVHLESGAIMPFSLELTETDGFGEYTMTYTGERNQAPPLTATKTFKYLPTIPGMVTVDQKGFFKVDGKRFFPLGAPDLHIAIERGWLTLEESRRIGFNTSGAHLSNIDEFAAQYKSFGYKFIMFIDPGYKVVYDQDWPRLREIMHQYSIRNPSIFSYQSGDEILGRVSKDTMIKAYNIISAADPYHPVSFYENHTEYVIDSFDAADFGQFDYYPIVSEAPVLNIKTKLGEQYAAPNSKPIVYVPEIFTAKKWDKSAVEPTSYEQVEVCAFLGITAKARGIMWWRAHYSEKHLFEWAKHTAEKIKPIMPILLTNDLTEEAKSLTPGLSTLSKFHQGKYYIITANSNNEAIGEIQIKLPANWKARSARELYSDKVVDLKNDTIIDEFSTPHGVAVYEIFSGKVEE